MERLSADSRREKVREAAYKTATTVAAVALVATIALFLVQLATASHASWRAFGLRFLWTTEWNPVTEQFGALPMIVGTLVTGFGALAISTPFALGIAIFLADYASKRVTEPFKYLISLLGGLPSVIFGLWGLIVLVPRIGRLEVWFGTLVHSEALVQAGTTGVGLLSSVVLLALMILPFSSSLILESLLLVPTELKEGSLALGATRWDTIQSIELPFVRKSTVGALVLALGRALGETMAVTMVIGNGMRMPRTLFDPANTLASAIANQFLEATSPLYVSALTELALILFVIAIVINIGARVILRRGVQQR
ncbi:MAG: phosphate ABC transporter permease subunit PstC [Caldisericota bacterium]|jgi:phosphate transport system permease protein|nr:phosphate ABC transporter permease subunit PstC [Caldisericota bacterium]